jgi:hypothetical protein
MKKMKNKYEKGDLVWVRRMREDDIIGVIMKVHSDYMTYDVLYDDRIKVVNHLYLMKVI